MCRHWQSGSARAWRRGEQRCASVQERASSVTVHIAAIVLAGGQSRRMGTDKALLCLPSGGPTLVERVVTVAWAAGADEVFVVGDGARLPTMNARMVSDVQPGTGPLAGLATGFAATQCDVALALACDLPYLSVPLLREMIAIAQLGVESVWDALVPFLPLRTVRMVRAAKTARQDGNRFTRCIPVPAFHRSMPPLRGGSGA